MSRATNIAATLLEGDDKAAQAKEIPGAFWYAYDADFGSYILHSCPCG